MSSEDDQSAMATPDGADGDSQEKEMNGRAKQDADSGDEAGIDTPNSNDDADLFGSDAEGDELEKPGYETSICIPTKLY